MSRKYPINSKEYDIKDRLRHKNIFCISRKWIKWAKSYLNRVERRKSKQIVRKENKNGKGIL